MKLEKQTDGTLKKITWHELEDQGYTPINHIGSRHLDYSSIPAEKQELVSTVLRAEITADDEKHLEEQRAKDALSRLATRMALAQLRAERLAAKSHEDSTAIHSAEERTVHSIGGQTITDSERQAFIDARRDGVHL